MPNRYRRRGRLLGPLGIAAAGAALILLAVWLR